MCDSVMSEAVRPQRFLDLLCVNHTSVQNTTPMVQAELNVHICHPYSDVCSKWNTTLPTITTSSSRRTFMLLHVLSQHRSHGTHKEMVAYCYVRVERSARLELAGYDQVS